jgi:HKD family nuclease
MSSFFYNQPIAHRFGKALIGSIESGEWKRIEIAVAWVRRSGTKHVKPCLSNFLSAGGIAKFTVGIDIENTSKEGLEDLLGLQDIGDSESYIYHNEANATFHPKVYLLQNENRTRLIVGSNNITEAGLYVNTEAGLQLDAASNDPLIVEVREALASWRDISIGFVKRLDRTLLRDLVALGYVMPETTLRGRRRQSESEAKAKRSRTKQLLFQSLNITVPPTPPSLITQEQITGAVLLMRVRRASETARRTQVQIPIRVIRTKFFEGITEIVSAHDGRSHTIITASARGLINTMKVELPEIDPMTDPVVRLERTATAIVYQTFDANSVLGRPIMDALRKGIEFNPPVTFLTTPQEPQRATWWRFI